jgi:hypothetical protein
MTAQAPPATTDDLELARTLDTLGFGETDMERRAAQTEAAQLARWGATGFDIIGVHKAPEVQAPTRACEACGGPLPSSGPGRPRRFCSDACRQRAHRAGVGRASGGNGRRGEQDHQRAFRDTPATPGGEAA